MKRLGILIFSVLVLSWASPRAHAAFATPYVPGNWVLGGGFGLTFGPTLVLLTPSMDYVVNPRVLFGPQMQLGIGDGFTLVTLAGSLKYIFTEDPRLRPYAEGALGIALASGFGSSAGVLIQMGMGVDYQLNRQLSVGTVFRLNIAPPLKTFFVSWPLVNVRFLI